MTGCDGRCASDECVCPPIMPHPDAHEPLALDRLVAPDLFADKWLLFDGANNLDNRWYWTFAAALQGARSATWRHTRWIIFTPEKQGGGIARRYDSGEEFEYWSAMKARGSANTGPIPSV